MFSVSRLIGTGLVLTALFEHNPLQAQELAANPQSSITVIPTEIQIRPANPQARQTASLILSPAAVSDEARVTASTAGQSAPVSAASGPSSPRMTYIQAYNSIPFNRAEYEANPAYRHEAALELMFGQMRPTTVVKQTMPYFSRYPDFMRSRSTVYPYSGSASSTYYFFPYTYSQYAY